MLGRDSSFEETLKRFEHMRGYGLLPRDRENAGVRLSDRQIASAVLAISPVTAGFAGHASTVLGGLRAVGGPAASFRNAATLRETLEAILASDEACRSVVAITLSIEHEYASEEYRARAVFEEDGRRRTVSFVSKLAVSLLSKGAEARYDHDRMDLLVGRQMTLGRKFFDRLRREVVLSRHLDRPLKTDWREYESEEERDAFNKSLGARPNSVFLNLPVDTGVPWPDEPTRIKFSGRNLILFPKTPESSHSISIDLKAESIDAGGARTLLNRFLSLLAWCGKQHAVLGGGWEGSPIPRAVPRQDRGRAIAQHWIFDRTVPEDIEHRVRLAYFREGLNARAAGLYAFEVLSFFKVFEIREPSRRGTPNPTTAWIRETYPKIETTLPAGERQHFEREKGDVEVAKYLSDNCRVAVAHTSAATPSDADALPEIRRLASAAVVIRALAEYYLKEVCGLSDRPYEVFVEASD